jgi:hypothetical protein
MSQTIRKIHDCHIDFCRRYICSYDEWIDDVGFVLVCEDSIVILSHTIIFYCRFSLRINETIFAYRLVGYYCTSTGGYMHSQYPSFYTCAF